MSDTDTDTNEPQTDSAEPVAEPALETPAGDADAVIDEDGAAAEADAVIDEDGAAAEADAVIDEDGAAAEADAVAGEVPAEVAASPAPATDETGERAADAEPVVDEVTEVEAAPATDEAAEVEAEPAANGEAAAAEPTDLPDEAAGDVITDEELLERAPAESPYDRPGRWFVVHTQSGYEKKVKQNLEARIVSMNAEDAIYEVVIPMEDYVDFRNGKRIVAQRKMFPGYLLVRAALDDQAWFVIRNTPGVTGFVGQGAKPSPLPRRDVESFLMPKGGTEEQVAQRAKPRLEYEIGETVRVKEGPFADFSGEVIELNEDQLKLKVLVNIFGRETPVELEFSKVAKL
jgi:transcription termination/antitermination protein NusG